MFKFVVDNLDGVDENLRQYYKKREDGKYQLDVEGAVPREKLDEFRNNNIRLEKDLKKFEGIDPTKYQEAIDKAAKAKTDDDLEALVTQRTKSMSEQHAAALKDVTDKLNTAESSLNDFRVSSEIKDVALELGANPKALPDILSRAKSVYRLHEGKVTPFNEKGDIIYGTDGLKPKTPTEWVTELAKDASHLFEQNKGGGAGNTRQTKSTANMTSAEKIRAGLEEMN